MKEKEPSEFAPGEFVRVTYWDTPKKKRSFWAKKDGEIGKANLYIPVDGEGVDLSHMDRKGRAVLPKHLIPKELIISEEPAQVRKKDGLLVTRRPELTSLDVTKDIWLCTVSELRSICRGRGLSGEGNKEDLVRRYRSWVKIHQSGFLRVVREK